MFAFFRKYGEILEVQMMRERNGTSKGCAFVKFESMTKAEEAIDALKGTHLEGMNNPIQIRWADGEEERLGVKPDTLPKLFIGSLPKECTESQLREIFEQFGQIEELYMMKEADGKTNKGCALLVYKLKESAIWARNNLNAQAYIPGYEKPIEVKFADKKQHSTMPPHIGGGGNAPDVKSNKNLYNVP